MIEPIWIVNDLGELGVKVNGRCFFLYKGNSIEYGKDKNGVDGVAVHDDGTPMRYRIVNKREFGEVQHPASWLGSKNSDQRYTVNMDCIDGLSDDDLEERDWKNLPAAEEQLKQEKHVGFQLIPISQTLPPWDEHNQVLVYTEGTNFGGEQFFTRQVRELYLKEAEWVDEVIPHVTHWCELPYPDANATQPKPSVVDLPSYNKGWDDAIKSMKQVKAHVAEAKE